MNRNNIFILVLFWVTGLGGNAQRLEDYYQIAAENNPGLKAKYAAYEAALQRIPQARSLADPTFSFGYFISPVETRVGAQRARFSLTQMFPWFGSLKAQGDVAALAAEAQFQEFLDARNALYFRVAQAWYPLYELQKLRLLERENIRLLESFKTTTTQKYENGMGAMVDVIRVDLLLNEANTQLEILDKKEASLTSRFNTLLNRGYDEPVVVADSLAAGDMLMDYRKDSLLVNHPRMAALDLKLKSAEAAEKVALKQGLPKIGVGLDYVLVDERSDMVLEDNGKDVLMPMVTVTIPIFRKKYRAARQEARFMQEGTALEQEALANELTAAYHRATFELQQQADLVALYAQQSAATRQAMNLLLSAYGNSGKDFEEVLRIQQQLLKYERLNTTALSQYFIALEEVNYITAKTR
ncbi:TolC family protein [Geofilum rhodophaeum]|uniref:TolC family protein n=1 Tax=Geofilum rhodophaeum TaxID=1965019 RepID=UPI000B5286B1|nr:TolC family protein [Geofilum rhodophaeum]